MTQNISRNEFQYISGLNTKNGVLCTSTAFVEFSEQVYQTRQVAGDSRSDSNDDDPRHWARVRRCRGLKECSAPRDSSNVDEPRVQGKRGDRALPIRPDVRLVLPLLQPVWMLFLRAIHSPR
jgi:hypothetical protein